MERPATIVMDWAAQTYWAVQGVKTAALQQQVRNYWRKKIKVIICALLSLKGHIFKLLQYTFTIGQLIYLLRLTQSNIYFFLSESVEGRATVVKGCVAKSICDSKTLANRFQDISCCKGNLCNGDESVAESITQSFIQNITQSFMYDDDESVTQSFIQSVTQSFVYNNAENVKYSDAKSAKKSFMYDDAKSVTYNVAQSVSQSFLFFCTSLLFFILLN